jgi:hypothetical protein
MKAFEMAVYLLGSDPIAVRLTANLIGESRSASKNLSAIAV